MFLINQKFIYSKIYLSLYVLKLHQQHITGQIFSLKEEVFDRDILLIFFE